LSGILGKRNKFNPVKIYNLNGTANATVHTPNKDIKQAGSVTLG
jgi:hypothetical protein